MPFNNPHYQTFTDPTHLELPPGKRERWHFHFQSPQVDSSLILGPGAHLELVESFGPQARESSLRFHLHPKAQICWGLYGFTQGPLTFVRQGPLMQGASLTFVSHQRGPQSQGSLEISLAAPKAQAQISTLMTGREDWEQSFSAQLEHLFPETTSSQLSKGLFSEGSRGTLKGSAKIHPQAQKSQVKQLLRGLLLSPKARAQTGPNLEVQASDVQASHGATVGELDSESLFYLTSRGMEESSARQLMIEGFCREIFESLPNDDLRRFFQCSL